MRRFSLVSFSVLLLVAAACGSSSSDNDDISDPEIRSQDDVQRFFEAVMPSLVEAFTQLANEQLSAASALSSSIDKGGGGSTSVPCPEGGELRVDPSSGSAMLVGCTDNGITISAPSLMLAVEPIGPSSYRATFSGPLEVSGTFMGMIQVVQASIQWTDPANAENTCWEVTVRVNGNEESAQCEDCSCRGGGISTVCEWNRSGQMNEVRVHVGNVYDLAGIFVTLSYGPEAMSCTIEDENGDLQLPVFGNTFPDGDTLGGLGQALLPLGVGDMVNVAATYEGTTAQMSCEVSQEAYETGNPEATAGQAFLDVFVDSGFPNIQCGFGFVLFDTIIRYGGECVPGQQGDFTCTSLCIDICAAEGETSQLAACGLDSVCECTCVNYNL